MSTVTGEVIVVVPLVHKAESEMSTDSGEGTMGVPLVHEGESEMSTETGEVTVVVPLVKEGELHDKSEMSTEPGDVTAVVPLVDEGELHSESRMSTETREVTVVEPLVDEGELHDESEMSTETEEVTVLVPLVQEGELHAESEVSTENGDVIVAVPLVHEGELHAKSELSITTEEVSAVVPLVHEAELYTDSEMSTTIEEVTAVVPLVHEGELHADSEMSTTIEEVTAVVPLVHGGELHTVSGMSTTTATEEVTVVVPLVQVDEVHAEYETSTDAGGATVIVTVLEEGELPAESEMTTDAGGATVIVTVLEEGELPAESEMTTDAGGATVIVTVLEEGELPAESEMSTTVGDVNVVVPLVHNGELHAESEVSTKTEEVSVIVTSSRMNLGTTGRETGRGRTFVSKSRSKPNLSTTYTPTPCPQWKNSISNSQPQGQRSARKVHRLFGRRGTNKDDELALIEALSKLSLIETSPVFAFDEMGLKPELHKGILANGMEKPAVCQQSVILPMIQGRDVICQAQSGMGKTAAFCISILQRLDSKNTQFKALVLAPTRELAEQILSEFRAFAQYMNIRCVPCIGGTVGGKLQNLKDLENGDFHVIVGTIGRVSSLLIQSEGTDKNGVAIRGLFGDSIKILVVDEADKMLTEDSYRPELARIFWKISPWAQIIVTSATLPSVAFDRCREVMRKPYKFLLRNENLTLDGIRQFYINVGTYTGKLSTLNELFPFLKQSRGITFCNTRSGAEYLARKMKEKNHAMEDMTANLDQTDRNSRFQDFKSGRVPVLIASDLLGRGLDVHHVQLVVNYDVPRDKEQYIHRIGRAGRYGKKGLALTFVTDREVEKIKQLEEFYHTEIPELRTRIGDLMNELVC